MTRLQRYEGGDRSESAVDVVSDALTEIERLWEWKAVADLFGAAFRLDEWGQYPPSNADGIHQAACAYERLRTKEFRRG